MKAGLSLTTCMLAVGCTTVTVSHVDHCTIQRTHSWAGSTRDEIVFCDREAPRWSEDRTLRLTQECLYEADLNRRDGLIYSSRLGHLSSPMPTEDAFAQCYPDTVKSIQAENEALKERLKRNEEMHAQLDGQREKFDEKINGQRDKFETDLNGQREKWSAQLDGQREKWSAQLDGQREKLESELDTQRERLDDRLDKQRTSLDDQRERLESRLEGQHEKIETALVAQHGELDAAVVGQNGKLQETLSKALSRPLNAVATAKATSDSNVKHDSDSKELARFNYVSSTPPVQNVQAGPERTKHSEHSAPKASPAKACQPLSTSVPALLQPHSDIIPAKN